MTDIFKAKDVRGKVGSEINYEMAEKLGKAFADVLSAEGPVAVYYGKDPAVKEVTEGVIEGLRLQGREVWNQGTFKDNDDISALVTIGTAGTVLVTGEPDEILIRLLNEDGELVDNSGGLNRIKELVEQDNFVPSLEQGRIIKK